MSIDQDITNLPTPPSRSDSPSDFSDKADTFLAALPQLQTELNTYADEANTTQTAINTSENNAATSEQNAEDWAVDLTGLVLSTDYSAKAYAVSENLVPEGAAKEWAIKLGTTVDGSEFSAKKYANDAEASASAAAATAGATAWSAGVTYNTNDAAIGSDGNTYRSLVDNNLGNDPVLGDGSNWLNLTGSAAVEKATLTKTFAAGESASLTLSEPVETAPVVSVTKEIPQTGVTTNDWDVAADGANFTLHDTAYDTTLTPETFGFGLGAAKYDGVSFSTSAQEFPYGFEFNNDGTKMYIIGTSTDSVYQYTLSTAFDLSTATYDNIDFSVSDQDNTPFGFTFSANGTKMYIIGISTDSVYQYTLSTAFDLSTASYDNVSFSVSGQGSSNFDITFNNNGNKMYIVDTNGFVYQYTLSTAFDLSTASYDNVFFDTSTQSAVPRAIKFNNDGSKAYIADSSTDSVYQYSLSSEFDISTISYDNILFNVSSEDTDVSDITFNNDGSKMYIAGLGSQSIYQYTTSKEALVLGSGSFATEDVGKRVVGNGGEAILTATDGSYIEQTAFNDDSTIAAGDWSMFALDVADNADLGLTLSGLEIVNGFQDASNWSYDSVSLDISSQETNVRDIAFSADGSKVYIIGSNTDFVHQYSLNTAFNLSTASYDNVSFDVSSQDTSPYGIAFNTDGTNMYMVGSGSNSVHQYTLSTAFDLSTASYDSVSFSVSSQDATAEGITFNTDGTNMYMVGSNTDSVYQYSLSTAFDLSTASYDNVSFSVSGQETSPQGITFNTDGTKMYMIGTTSDSVHQYTLSTAFDLSTASYDSVSFSVSSQDTFPTGMVFSTSGSKMYISGLNNNSIFQYSTAEIFNYIPTSTNHTAVTSASIDTEFWTDINSMTVDDASNEGNVYYAVSTDDRTTWRIIDDTEGERAILRNNGGTWEVNDDSNYGSETWVAASENDEFYALEEAVEVDTAQVEDSFRSPSDWFYSGNSFDGAATLPGNPHSLFFKTDGSKMFIVDSSDNVVFEYDLSVSWDISSALYSGNSFDFSSQDGAMQEVFFRDDGTKMYLQGNLTDSVHEYNLSTAWDITTVSYTGKTLSGINNPQGLFFKPDGTKIFVGSTNTNLVYEYGLSTPWDINTATQVSTLDLSAQTTTPRGLSFNNDGTKIYILADGEDSVFEYESVNAWDLTGFSYTGNSFNVADQDARTKGIFFKPDGLSLFYLGKDTLSVYEYTTGVITSTNRMDAAQLNAVSDANHYTLGDDLDLAITFFMADGNTNSPTSDGVSVNYDANVLNQGAVLGTDYEFDKPTNDTVRITALSDENFKVRVV